MSYLRVLWKHELPDEPVVLYSELNADRFEVRKIELFRDGRCGHASATASSEGTQLSIVPVPERTSIAQQPEFEPTDITQEEFEAVWARGWGGR